MPRRGTKKQKKRNADKGSHGFSLFSKRRKTKRMLFSSTLSVDQRRYTAACHTYSQTTPMAMKKVVLSRNHAPAKARWLYVAGRRLARASASQLVKAFTTIDLSPKGANFTA